MCILGKPEEGSDYDTVTSYTGETKLGKRHGKGLYLYPNGDMYDGYWRWGKKHGYGTYTFVGGTRQVGYFYDDKYKGIDPGNLFAKDTKGVWGDDPAKPLTPPPTKEECEAEERQNAERQAMAYERYLENERRREERKKRRDEIRKKYDLAVPSKASTSPRERSNHSNRPRDAGRRRDRLLDPSKRVGYDSLNF